MARFTRWTGPQPGLQQRSKCTLSVYAGLDPGQENVHELHARALGNARRLGLLAAEEAPRGRELLSRPRCARLSLRQALEHGGPQ